VSGNWGSEFDSIRWQQSFSSRVMRFVLSPAGFVGGLFVGGDWERGPLARSDCGVK
jgi:hypothetical protein